MRPPRPKRGATSHKTILNRFVRQSQAAPNVACLVATLPTLLFKKTKNRDDMIRTCDPLVPSEVRYQAAPHPDIFKVVRTTVIKISYTICANQLYIKQIFTSSINFKS